MYVSLKEVYKDFPEMESMTDKQHVYWYYRTNEEMFGEIVFGHEEVLRLRGVDPKVFKDEVLNNSDDV